MVQIMKSGMNQVQVPPFELKLRQDVATAPRNPKITQKSGAQVPPGGEVLDLDASILKIEIEN